MKLFIKENSSWSVEKLEVLDEKGNVCYMAEGESLNKRNTVRIFDKDDSEIARIDYMLDGTNASYEIDFSNPEDKLPIILLVLTIYTIYSYKFSQRAGCQ